MATARCRDVNIAKAESFVQATPRVSGPGFGAMGADFVLPIPVGAGVPNADEPQALIYEPAGARRTTAEPGLRSEPLRTAGIL